MIMARLSRTRSHQHYLNLKSLSIDFLKKCSLCTQFSLKVDFRIGLTRFIPSRGLHGCMKQHSVTSLKWKSFFSVLVINFYFLGFKQIY